MRVLDINRLSTIVLWICMAITVVIFAAFYVNIIIHPDSADTGETSALLIWMYAIQLITIVVTCVFSLFLFIRKCKEEPREAWKLLLWLILPGVAFILAYSLGSGTPLVMTGYDGTENTYYWLKMTDMWLYITYILLGLTFLSIFVGIIWSNYKKSK